MSIANWNPTAYYLIGDEVYDGSAKYYIAIADNINTSPPSAPWALVPSGTFTPSYASFYSTATQPLTAGVELIMSYNGTFIATPDITLSTPTTIRIGTTGIYSFLYSIQADKTMGSGTPSEVEVYIRNAVVFPNSSSRTQITNQVEIVLTCEYILPFTAGDTISVAAYTTGNGIQFPYFAPLGPAPATPSIITNIKRIA